MSPGHVEEALTAPAAEVGVRLLGLVENQWFDRKSAQTRPQQLAVVISAFANAEGGVVALGLHDGVVEGMRRYESNVNELRQASLDFTQPPVDAKFTEIQCVNARGEPDFVLVVKVQPSESVHELKNGTCYLRVGDESRKLGYTQRQELHFDKGQSQYDGMPAAGVDLSLLSAELLDEYRTRISSSDAMKALHARSLVTRTEQVTNAAYLLFGEHPQDVFPEAYVRVLRFVTKERGTGARLGLDEAEDHRYEGPISSVLEGARSKIDELVPRRRSLTGAGRFEGSPIVPRDAWLEGLVNAIVHRSYSLAGDHIRVEIYPDRVEIESPGRFPGLANPANPLEVNRFARNPRIARVCADLRIGQELGEGIRRIFEEMRKVGLTDPVYSQTPGSVKLSLVALPRIDPRVAARLPDGSQKVLDAMRSAENSLGTGQIAEMLGMSRPTLGTRLKALEVEGLIRWKGKSPKDPRAVWELVD